MSSQRANQKRPEDSSHLIGSLQPAKIRNKKSAAGKKIAIPSDDVKPPRRKRKKRRMEKKEEPVMDIGWDGSGLYIPVERRRAVSYTHLMRCIIVT